MLGADAATGTIASFDGVTRTALEFLSKQGGLTDPALTRVFYDLQNDLIMPGLFGCVTAVFLVSVGAAAVGGIVAARWVGWLSLVLAALSVLSSVIGLTLANGGTSGLGFFPAVGFAVSALITSTFMLREREAGVTPPPPNCARVAAYYVVTERAVNGEPAMMTLARSVARRNAHEVVHPAEHRRRHPGNHSARYFMPPRPWPKPSTRHKSSGFWIRPSTLA